MRGLPQYEFLGVTRFWRYDKEAIQKLYEEGRIVQPKPGTVPRYKRYLDEMPDVAVADVWEDIQAVQGVSNEFLGYLRNNPSPFSNESSRHLPMKAISFLIPSAAVVQRSMRPKS